MWADHSFSERELDRWADDILDAALQLSTEGRSRLLDASCRGSDALRARVEALLADEWPAHDVEVLPPGSVQPGAILNECVILARIGSGGSGEVYKAIDMQLPRRVAVKVLSRLSVDQRATLRSEARNLSRFAHPNIATVHRADFHAATPSLVMEFAGTTLRGWLKEHGLARGRALPDAVILSLLEQMGAAVGEVHQAGIVHADVKPENFLIAPQSDGSVRVKLIDFGIARFSNAATDQVRGTPGYIAPEQIKSEPADERSDVFALGVVLFEMVLGYHPFSGNSDFETLSNTVYKEPDFGTSKTRFHKVIDRALRKQPNQRYRSVHEMVEDAETEDPPSDPVSLINPLLTEFPDRVQQWLQVGSTGFVLAATSSVWGAVSLILSFLIHTACLRVLWRADHDSVPQFEMRFGYLIEPNAGVWYLVFTSLFVLGVFAFLRASHHGFARTSALTLDGASDSVRLSNRIGQLNRRIFSIAAVPIVGLAIGHVYWAEIENRRSNAFGWVQADLAGESLEKTYAALRAQRVVGDVSAFGLLCPECSWRVVDVRNAGTGYVRPSAGLFGVFLASALSHEMFFSLFAIWAASKIVFVFSLLTVASMRESGRGIGLKPDFDDRDEYRFGLGPLDSVYVTTLVLTALGAVGFWFQKIANFGKGTDFLGGNAAAPLFGQLATILLVFALLVLLLAVPIVASLFLSVQSISTAQARNARARQQKESDLRNARTPAERDAIVKALDDLKFERETAKAQSVLPTRRGAVAFLGLLNFGLIVVPAGASFFESFRTTGYTVWSEYVELLCAACGVTPY